MKIKYSLVPTVWGVVYPEGPHSSMCDDCTGVVIYDDSTKWRSAGDGPYYIGQHNEQKQRYCYRCKAPRNHNEVTVATLDNEEFYMSIECSSCKFLEHLERAVVADSDDLPESDGKLFFIEDCTTCSKQTIQQLVRHKNVNSAYCTGCKVIIKTNLYASDIEKIKESLRIDGIDWKVYGIIECVKCTIPTFHYYVSYMFDDERSTFLRCIVCSHQSEF